MHIVKKQATLARTAIISAGSVKCGCVTVATLKTVFHCGTHGG